MPKAPVGPNKITVGASIPGWPGAVFSDLHWGTLLMNWAAGGERAMLSSVVAGLSPMTGSAVRRLCEYGVAPTFVVWGGHQGDPTGPYTEVMMQVQSNSFDHLQRILLFGHLEVLPLQKPLPAPQVSGLHAFLDWMRGQMMVVEKVSKHKENSIQQTIIFAAEFG